MKDGSMMEVAEVRYLVIEDCILRSAAIVFGLK